MQKDQRARPRAFRLDELDRPLPGDISGTRPPLIVEPETDPYEAEVQRAFFKPEGDEAAVELADRKGILRRTRLSWSSLFWSALAGLFSLSFGVWLTSLFDALFARAPALGVFGVVLAALAILALFVILGREISAVSRQRHITQLHIDFAQARALDDRDAARTLIKELMSLYKARPGTAQARAHLNHLAREIVDGRDLIDIAERSLVEPLDANVRAAIANASRRVSMVTALAPRAIIDVVFVAAQAITLIRQISTAYGGRPGLWGFLKLLRTVGTHLAITGGMAATDTIVQQLVGHGIAAKLSARLGEGVLNGLLTARVGLSAMAVCRPMPFADGKAPSISDVAPFLLKTEKPSVKE
jgi:putative membrane protein